MTNKLSARYVIQNGRWQKVLFLPLSLAFLLGLLLGLLALQATPTVAETNTLIVNSTADSGPGTLRQALFSAIPGDTITFDPGVFPPTSPMTITLLSALLEINQGNLTIDASNAGVVLDGRYATGANGFHITSDGNVIKGLQIIRFPGDGVEITDGAKHNTIGGDWTVGGAPHGEGNVITLNGNDGVNINGTGTMSNTVSGNLIGLDVDGTRDFRVQAMAISPNYANDQTLFVGTKFHGVWKTTDGGNSWAEVNNGLSILDVRALAISPNYATDRSLFAGTADGGIFRTTSGDGSWTRVDGGVTDANVRALAISPDYASDGHVFAATEGDGVFASTDGGDTWVARNSGLTDTGLETLAISPNYGVDRTLFAAGRDSIFKSVNQGYSWTVASSDTITSIEVLAISPNYASDRTLFIGTDQCYTAGTLWKSTDGGSSWAATGEEGFDWCHMRALAISPNYATDQTLFAGDMFYGVFKSSDGSTNWLNVQFGRFNRTLSVSPAYAQDQTLFVGRGNGSIFKSVNGGVAWTEVSAGLTERGNYWSGVHLSNGTQGNTIGGDSPGERNVITNNAEGVSIHDSGTANNTVSGNYIGTDASGTAALGNDRRGVDMSNGVQYNRVGGSTPAERNVISGHGDTGVGLNGSGTMSNTISGNYIGTDASGLAALGNRWGVTCGDAQRNIIEDNVIGASEGDTGGGGIYFDSCHRNTIAGNYIGTDATGTADLGNRNDGISFNDGARQNVIGAGNVIAYNKSNGIRVWGSTTLYNTITHNSIHSNSGMGIDNGDGGNAELLPPALTDVTANSVSGTAPVAYATIEIFSDDEDEGRVYEGATTAGADGLFTFTKATDFTGPYLTATATDPDGNTSEFSQPVSVLGPPTPTPTPTATPATTSTPTDTPTPTNTPTATPTPTPVVLEYCCYPGDSLYRVDDSSFYGYDADSASDSPLIRVTSPPAPGGWYQPDFAPDSSWQPASEVWWDDWDAPGWQPLPGDGDCRPLGLQDEYGNQEAQSGTTHLYRRTFTLSPPYPDMQVTQATLEMWSDNKTEWWWEGISVSYDREGYIGQVDLFPGHINPNGGTYVIAIQNSNDRASHHNPQGTACYLRVTWAVPGALDYQVYLPLILKGHP